MGRARAALPLSINLSNRVAMLPADAREHPADVPETGVPLSGTRPCSSWDNPAAMTAPVAHTPHAAAAAAATVGSGGII